VNLIQLAEMRCSGRLLWTRFHK